MNNAEQKFEPGDLICTTSEFTYRSQVDGWPAWGVVIDAKNRSICAGEFIWTYCVRFTNGGKFWGFEQEFLLKAKAH